MLFGCAGAKEDAGTFAPVIFTQTAGVQAETEADTAKKETETAATQEETEADEGQTEAASSAGSETGKLTVTEDGVYITRDEVALYLHLYGRLPSNFITKKEAEALGWKQKQGEAGELSTVAPGKSIGGSRFGNYEEKLPKKDGRTYYECDIEYESGNRNAKRLVYSNDGLIFYTEDHYETFEQLYPTE
ncbi:MAG: ribonuclease [Lachnospiraceae bacterium]|nr:ribonuclease [Lachnospiraceae bacterium]